MILQELPDAKFSHKILSVGTDYVIIGELGENGLIVKIDEDTNLVLLGSRFQDRDTIPE